MDTLLTFLWNLASFILVLGVLVTFHEYGHFWVARRAGVKVLKFSVGFGKPLYRWYGKDGVEYIIAQLPLGGYVKMLDENEGEVAEELKSQSFNQASLSKRFAIVAAGPVANLLLAIFLFWLTFMVGIPAIKPIVGTIHPHSAAFEAGVHEGDLITSIDNIAVETWGDVRLQLATHLGEKGRILLKLQNPDTLKTYQATLVLKQKIGANPNQDPIELLGFDIFIPEPDARVGEVTIGSAAAKAGILKGDIIKSIDHQKIEKWSDISHALINKAQQTVELTVDRKGQWIDLNVLPSLREGDNSNNGYLGIRFVIDDSYKKMVENISIDVSFGPLESLSKAWDKTATMFSLSVKVIFKMISGEVSVKNLSGPVGIAQGAGNSANAGLGYFLSFMAMISVSLGFLNLLPVPVLDGGHLFFYTIEAMMGKPVPEKIQAFGMQIGIVLIITLTAIALFNDFTRIGF